MGSFIRKIQRCTTQSLIWSFICLDKSPLTRESRKLSPVESALIFIQPFTRISLRVPALLLALPPIATLVPAISLPISFLSLSRAVYTGGGVTEGGFGECTSVRASTRLIGSESLVRQAVTYTCITIPPIPRNAAQDELYDISAPTEKPER